MVAVLKSKLAVKCMKSVNPGEIRECRSRARHPFLSGCLDIGKNTYGTLERTVSREFSILRNIIKIRSSPIMLLREMREPLVDYQAQASPSVPLWRYFRPLKGKEWLKAKRNERRSNGPSDRCKCRHILSAMTGGLINARTLTTPYL
jgi:hypothetical protein